MDEEIFEKTRVLLDMLFQGRDFASGNDEMDRTVEDLDQMLTDWGYPSANPPVAE